GGGGCVVEGRSGADEVDVAVAGGEQLLRRGPARRLLVRDDRRELAARGGQGVEEDGRERVELGGQLLALPGEHRRDDEAVDPVVEHRLDRLALLRRTAARLA